MEEINMTKTYKKTYDNFDVTVVNVNGTQRRIFIVDKNYELRFETSNCCLLDNFIEILTQFKNECREYIEEHE